MAVFPREFTIDHDTIIDTILYHVIYSDFEILGRIRTNNNKVYFTPDKNTMYFRKNIEYLMYDYNILPGDEFESSPKLYSPVNLNYAATDTATLSNGATIPKYNSAGAYNFWIYGIGSVQGLLGGEENITYHPPLSVGVEMFWYCNPYFTYRFPDVKWDCNTVFNTGIDENITKEAINIYPNPLWGNFLSLESAASNKIIEISITDLSGRTLLHYNDPFKNTVNQTINVNLQSGIYLVVLKMVDNSVVTRKLNKW